MTNQEIIFKEAVLAKLYTEEEALAIIAEHGSLSLHTYATWKSLGYQVKKGEHAIITTKLWKKKRNDGTDRDPDSYFEDSDNETTMYLVKSFLFSRDQVEAISQN